MGRVSRVIATWLGGVLVVWLVATLIPGELFGEEAAHPSPGTSATPADVVLTVQEGILSLRARDASLKSIFEAIGRQLHIEVVARIPADERITIAFEQLSLTEALKRFRPSVNYLVARGWREGSGYHPQTHRGLEACGRHAIAPDHAGGRRIGTAEPGQRPAPTPEAPARAKPFSFEFDPTAVGERGR